MFKFRKRAILLIAMLISFSVSVPSYSQESTETPPPAPTEVTEAATTEAPVVTEAATTEAPVVTETVATEAATTEAPVVTEAPATTEAATAEITEEALVTEVATEAPTVELTAEITEEAIIATETPETSLPLVHVPSGNEVEMLLRYNPIATEASIQEMLRALGAVELERLAQIGVMRVLIPSSVSNTTAAVSTLQSNRVASAAGLTSLEPNIVWTLDFEPNDTYFQDDSQPNLSDNNSGGSIFAELAWDISPRDGSGVVVAVLDSGVDLQHPEFGGRLVAGWDFYNDDNNPDDDNGHGTHVAGVIAARTNNGVGVAGIAFNAKIMPIKVCGPGGCPVYEIAAGIIYATDRGARVINMSLGGTAISTTVQGAVNYALSRNVVVVAAAGNDGVAGPSTEAYFYPASYPGVISVASVNPNGSISDFSNSNDRVTVAAPGGYILSTWPLNIPELTEIDGWLTDSPGIGYEYIGGTSMASPHVAGVAALLIADGIATTPATVREALICSAKDDIVTVGYDNDFGFGLIQADWALTWRENSASCQVSQPNDLIQNATAITRVPFSTVQAINTRSVTESNSDPTVGGLGANQTLWYSYVPRASGMHQISTFGSNYDTLLGVYQGQPGSLLEIAGNNDAGIASGPSHLMVGLTKGVTYYIQVGTNGADVSNAIMQLNVHEALKTSNIQQENAKFISYTGSWVLLRDGVASGGRYYSTSDSNARVSFLVRGTDLNLSRLIGPTQGSFTLYVDGVSQGNISNLAAITTSQVLNIPLGSDTGEWHLVMLHMANGTTAPISIDNIQVSDGELPTAAVGTARLNETASAFNGAFRNGTWVSNGSAGAFGGDVRVTGDVNAFVEFRANGSIITFYRTTGVGTGTMEVWVDNVLYDVVDNTAFDNNASVPYSISNLTPIQHIVRIVHVSGTQLMFDGARAIYQTSLRAGSNTDERSTSIGYSGNWVLVSESSAVANAGTLSTFGDSLGGGSAEFIFSGNHLCVGYRQDAANGLMDVIVDGVNIGTIDASGATLGKVEWCTDDNGVYTLSDSEHRVRLQVNAGNVFQLDYVRPERQTVFTSAMGYIAESNSGIFYNNAFGTWGSTTQRSLGGAKFQGGSARFVDVSSITGQRLSFTINGTGFILYTGIAPDAGAYEVYVDGSGTPLDFTFGGAVSPFLDLWDGNFRFRPIGLGIIDLPLGIHHIELRAIDPYNEDGNVYFDGIRVLP